VVYNNYVFLSSELYIGTFFFNDLIILESFRIFFVRNLFFCFVFVILQQNLPVTWKTIINKKNRGKYWKALPWVNLLIVNCNCVSVRCFYHRFLSIMIISKFLMALTYAKKQNTVPYCQIYTPTKCVPQPSKR